jgi:hypothetical protein
MVKQSCLIFLISLIFFLSFFPSPKPPCLALLAFYCIVLFYFNKFLHCRGVNPSSFSQKKRVEEVDDDARSNR